MRPALLVTCFVLLACGDDDVLDASSPADAAGIDVARSDTGSVDASASDSGDGGGGSDDGGRDVGDDVAASPDAGIDAGIDAGPVVNPDALFVSTMGDDTNDGRSREAAFRTITHAASLAEPGETVYVEAGVYAGENVVWANAGTETAQITLEGYDEEPGDRPTHDDFAPGVAFEPDRLPLLDGGDRAEGGIAIRVGDYITVRNLQITNYEVGINGYGSSHGEVHNTYLSTFGVNDDEVYSGKGIIMGSMADHTLVTNSVVINAGAEGIMLYADDSRIDGCVVYGNVFEGNLNSPDYYMMIKGNSNIIENSRVERQGEQWHGGHGIGIKGEGVDNIIRNNEAVGFRGSSFYLRHRGVMNNLVQDNTARDGADGGGSGIDFRDGTSGNTVERHTVINLVRGISFYDTSEDDGRHFSGNDNTVRDCSVTGVDYGVALHDYIYDDVFARRNVVENTTFEDVLFLFDLRSFGEENVMRGCTIRGAANFIRLHNGRSESDLGFSFEGNVLEDSDFSLP